MATTRNSLPQKPASFTPLGQKCEYYLRRAEEQRLRAREMMERAQEIRDLAQNMRAVPRSRATTV